MNSSRCLPTDASLAARSSKILRRAGSIAQAAPGPNVLFVATLGWSAAGPIGALAPMLGTLLPSTLLTLAVARWGASRKETRGVRAFTTGMTPLTIGLLVATGWLLAAPYVTDRSHAAGEIARVTITLRVRARTTVSPLWLVGLGALAGSLGWV